jgi:isoamylase
VSPPWNSCPFTSSSITPTCRKKRGLRNYWGYSSIGYFAPHNEYAADTTPGGQVREFREMVKALHGAGLEVILDVVYNHTSEGNHRGPMLSLKGLDNAAYYRLIPDDPRHYMDYTGTGNSLNMRHPHVLQLIMDSLRYWVLEMHVDGFRFDLASTLARELHEVDRLSAFFDIIQQDPVISQVKLIAEPWDIGEGGYQVGNFPPLWSEWNGRYRDTVRDFLARRGSHPRRVRLPLHRQFRSLRILYPVAPCQHQFRHRPRRLHPARPGLLQRKAQRGQRRGQPRRHRRQRAWNCGAEGPTDDPDINALRARQQRNFLATLMLSQGVPMLLGGDEIGRTQQGNNNAYCQDNEIAWYDWENRDADLLDFTRRLIRFQDEHPVFRRRRWFQGQAIHGSDIKDIAWFTVEGDQMAEEHWGEDFAKSLAVFLNGRAIPAPDPRGKRVEDDDFYLIFNAHHEALEFTLPEERWGRAWLRELDTAEGWLEGEEALPAKAKLRVEGRSVVILRHAS